MTRWAAFRSASATLLAAAVGASAFAQDPAPVDILVLADGSAVADAVVTLKPVAASAADGDAGPAAALTMSQHDLQFDPHVLVATVGGSVAFPNEDRVRHHVYSFSDAKTFELRLYGGEEEHVVLFDKPGVVSLGCNIHDNMIAFIYVADTPYAAQTGADGRAVIEGAPAGDYELTVWHENLRGQEVTRPITVSDAGASEIASIELRRPRRSSGY